MARLARVVIPGHPHHVTQRGNGRARTFFGDADYALYRDLLAENCRAAEIALLGLVPDAELDGTSFWCRPIPMGCAGRWRGCIGHYAGAIQARRKRSGHFWQGRFGAVAMDEEHLAAALRYVSLNPVRARLVERAQDWRWSSTRAHLRGKDDGLTALAPIRDRFPRFGDLLDTAPEDNPRAAERSDGLSVTTAFSPAERPPVVRFSGQAGPESEPIPNQEGYRSG